MTSTMSVSSRDPVEAMDAVRDMMEKKIFGAAGQTVVIEERLDGPEISLLAFVDSLSRAMPVELWHRRPRWH